MDPEMAAYVEALMQWAEIGKRQHDITQRLRSLEWVAYSYIGLHVLAALLRWVR